MALINKIEEKNAEGKLKELYKKMADPVDDKVANVLKVHSLNPNILEAHYDLYRQIMYGRSNLTRKEREMVAVMVSSVNDCGYWIEHHGAALHKLTRKNKNIVQQILNDYIKADISNKEKELLNYAEKLTNNNQKIDQKDINNLKQHGLIDKDILELNQVVAYFNYVNRIVDGLGVELEEERSKIIDGRK